MFEPARGPLSHLGAPRRPRGPRPMSMPLPVRLSALDHVQDCYYDYVAADASVCVIIAEVMPEPRIVSRIATGYSGQYAGPANQVLVAAGTDEPTGADR